MRLIPGAALSALLLIGAALRAQDLPIGRIVDEVRCGADPAQSYALYVPSSYSSTRQWSVLFAFHPAARGRAMVEKYAAAAEQYGYIVAASNNSRNGAAAEAAGAVRAMPVDVGRRFAIDPRRVYLTGMSGGSRVALGVALALGNDVAGVIASSAGFPDSQPRAKVAFPIFGTAGTEDFNYIEMRMLDRKLTTPHYLAVFEGGHTLPPDGVALEAIEWMELQAMKSGRRPRDETAIDRLLEKRRRALAASADLVQIVPLLDALVADFDGLRDVSAEAARAKDIRKDRDARKALDRERSSDDAEMRTLMDIFQLEAQLADDGTRQEAMDRLRDRVAKLSRTANANEGGADRLRARRILRVLVAGAPARVQDREYLALLEHYRRSGQGR